MVSPTVPRPVKSLIFALGPSNVAVGFILIYVPAYLPEINFSAAQVGLLIGLEGIVMIISAIPFGVLSDRRGRKEILFLGALAISPAIFIFAITTDFILLAIGSIVFGIAEAATLSTWNAIIADQTSLENRDSAFSLSFIVNNCLVAFGFILPLFIPAIQSVTSLSSFQVHRDIIAIGALAALFSAILIRIILRNYEEGNLRKETRRSSPRLVRGKNFGTLVKFSGINSLVGLGAGFIVPIITTWFYLRFHLPDAYTGTLLGISNLTIGLAAVLSPRLAKKYGAVNSIVATEGLSTIFMLSIAFIPNALAAAGTYIVRAALMNMSSPLADSYLMGLMSQEERGLASSLNSLIWRLPNSASTIVGGLILSSGNLSLPFFLATGLYVISITLFYSSFRNVRPSG